MSQENSPSRYQYRCTASHHRTLNVLGKVKNFAKLSTDELSGYCSLMKNDNGCESAAEVASGLRDSFGWPTDTRFADIEHAWKALDFSVVDDIAVLVDCDDDASMKKKFAKKCSVNSADTPKDQIGNASSIPIIIKNNAWDRKVLLCEVDDHEFNIAGDSGAVGRISVDSSSLLVDVKGDYHFWPTPAVKYLIKNNLLMLGRQYKGEIYSGPTVMLLNLAAPVGLPSGSSSSQQTARVEVLTNEYCQLTFERDLLGSMMGLYSGSMASYDDNQDDEDHDDVPKKARKRGNDDDNEHLENDETGNKLKAPKISTVTNRTRTAKKGTKKKISKVAKPKK